MSATPRILVIRRRYLGDVVLLGSLVRNLRLQWPEARIAVLCEPGYAGILRLNPDVNEAWTFPSSWRAWVPLLWRLRRAHFTHVLDLDNRDKTVLLTRATGAPIRVTQRHGAPPHLAGLYTASETLPSDFFAQRHIIDFYLQILTQIGVPIRSREVRLVPDPAEVAAGRVLLRGAKLLVHPGSRSAFRVWPPVNFARVITELQAAGIQAAVVAGPGEQAIVAEIFQHLSTPAVRIEATLGVTQLAALFAAAPVLLCHDSGPMHMAAAVGTKVVALFGSQPRQIWAPVGDGHVTLQPPLPCVSCIAPGTCVPEDSYRNYCVRNITPDRVLGAVRAALPAQ